MVWFARVKFNNLVLNDNLREVISYLVRFIINSFFSDVPITTHLETWSNVYSKKDLVLTFPLSKHSIQARDLYYRLMLWIWFQKSIGVCREMRSANGKDACRGPNVVAQDQAQGHLQMISPRFMFRAGILTILEMSNNQFWKWIFHTHSIHEVDAIWTVGTLVGFDVIHVSWFGWYFASKSRLIRMTMNCSPEFYTLAFSGNICILSYSIYLSSSVRGKIKTSYTSPAMRSVIFGHCCCTVRSALSDRSHTTTTVSC